jgi:hypothetical protein
MPGGGGAASQLMVAAAATAAATTAAACMQEEAGMTSECGVTLCMCLGIARAIVPTTRDCCVVMGFIVCKGWVRFAKADVC